jgi:hypothetical protein
MGVAFVLSISSQGRELASPRLATQTPGRVISDELDSNKHGRRPLMSTRQVVPRPQSRIQGTCEGGGLF